MKRGRSTAEEITTRNQGTRNLENHFMALLMDRKPEISQRKDISRRDLDVFFKPQSVAAIGATDRVGHVGRSVLWNLISSPFGGTVYPINAKKSSVLGIKAYPQQMVKGAMIVGAVALQNVLGNLGRSRVA